MASKLSKEDVRGVFEAIRKEIEKRRQECYDAIETAFQAKSMCKELRIMVQEKYSEQATKRENFSHSKNSHPDTSALKAFERSIADKLQKGLADITQAVQQSCHFNTLNVSPTPGAKAEIPRSRRSCTRVLCTVGGEVDDECGENDGGRVNVRSRGGLKEGVRAGLWKKKGEE